MSLTPQALDAYADTYYLNPEVEDIDIEELGQRLSIDRTVDVMHGARRVLELGFGTGLTAGEYLARGINYEVVEGSPRLCAVARERYPDLVVHEAMFESFVPDEPYDAVLALHVAEHVDDPPALFAQAARWLADDGALIVVVPNAESLHRRLAVEMGFQPALDTLSERDHLVGHQRVYTLDSLAADLATAGLRVDEEFGYQLKTVPNSMMDGYPPELLRALVTISDEIPPRMLANIGIRALKEAR